MSWAGPLFDGHECSLGYAVADWIEANCCHGEGDLLGQPARVDSEMLDHIVECYRIDPFTGRRVYNEAVLSRPKGRAKALALDTSVPTPTGWTTIGEIRCGDFVFDERGEPVEVIGVSETFEDHDCFEVSFSDGERIVADAGHRWVVEELRKEYRAVTVDTAYLAAHQRTRTDRACNFRLQMPGSLRLPDADLPVDPYVLGVWLGDGRTDSAAVTLADDEIVEELRFEGYRVEHRDSYGPYGHWVFGLNPELRSLGVLDAKHVPAPYLRASEKQRLALLQGLMDTDGTIGRDGRASFTSTLRCLVDAVVELLGTLGIKCSLAEFTTRLDGRDCGPAWKVDFWPASDTPVFRLSRKLCRQMPRRTSRRLADTRRIVNVRPVDSVQTRCIAVDSSSHLFLAGRRMVQTHNSEIAAWVALAEAFAPCVRFSHWDDAGQPAGRPVTSPLVKCLATEEGQAGNTFKTIAFIASDWGRENRPQVFGGATGARQYQSASAIYLPHGGEIRACTAGSASKDGGLETHVVVDETHLFVLSELRTMYATIARNLGKRFDADPWLHQTSTAYKPGEQSVFEATLTMWRKGELPESVFVNHREARGRVDLDDKPHTIAQLRYVYGVAAEWIDLDRKYRDMRDPRICRDDAEAARYFLNRPMSGKDAWIAKDVVERQRRHEVVEPGTAISLGFDGSLNDDSTVLIGSRMSDGFLFPLGIWAKPSGPEGNWWEVPRTDVLAAIREAFARYEVSRLYADPHEWRSDIDALAEEFGERVVAWETRRDVQMAAALDRLRVDLVAGSLWQSGDPVLEEHFANAYVRRKGGHRLVRKEHDQSSRKIDSVVGAALAYEARADALAAGWGVDMLPPIVVGV